METSNPIIPDRVPPADLDNRFKKALVDHLEHDAFRKKVKEILDDYTDAVPFMKKVKEYSKEQIELSVYQNLGFWVKTIGIPIGVTILTYFVLKSMGVNP